MVKAPAVDEDENLILLEPSKEELESNYNMISSKSDDHSNRAA